MRACMHPHSEAMRTECVCSMSAATVTGTNTTTTMTTMPIDTVGDGQCRKLDVTGVNTHRNVEDGGEVWSRTDVVGEDAAQAPLSAAAAALPVSERLECLMCLSVCLWTEQLCRYDSQPAIKVPLMIHSLCSS